MGLQEQADVRVGDSLNGGLSGGQVSHAQMTLEIEISTFLHIPPLSPHPHPYTCYYNTSCSVYS